MFTSPQPLFFFTNEGNHIQGTETAFLFLKEVQGLRAAQGTYRCNRWCGLQCVSSEGVNSKDAGSGRTSHSRKNTGFKVSRRPLLTACWLGVWTSEMNRPGVSADSASLLWPWQEACPLRLFVSTPKKLGWSLLSEAGCQGPKTMLGTQYAAVAATEIISLALVLDYLLTF